jgi:LAGLIDADG endonuclease
MKNKYKFNPKILNPDWVVGFIDGEGCFHVSIPKNKSMKLGYQVSLEFSITQHVRDRELMDKLVQFFNCGYVSNDTVNKVQYRIRDKKQLSKNLFRFLDHHSLLTIKLLDYLDFKKVHEMVEKGLHLTPEGLDEIRAIQSTMNRNRLSKR